MTTIAGMVIISIENKRRNLSDPNKKRFFTGKNRKKFLVSYLNVFQVANDLDFLAYIYVPMPQFCSWIKANTLIAVSIEFKNVSCCKCPVSTILVSYNTG